MNVYEFTCRNCYYTTKAAGGASGTRAGFSETMVCADCKIVDDVLTGFTHSDYPPPDQRKNAKIGRCRKCEGANLIKWTRPYPCPKCGKAMSKRKTRIVVC